jgi:hypothetical protein
MQTTTKEHSLFLDINGIATTNSIVLHLENSVFEMAD